MARKDDKPRFIRRNGKIIPIRSKKGEGKGKSAPKETKPKQTPKQRQAKEKRESGFKLIGLGAGITALGGLLGGALFAEGTRVKALNKAATEKNKAIFKAPDLFSSAEIKASAKRAKETKKKSDLLFRGALNTRRGALFAGSAAATAGLRKFFDDDRGTSGEVAEEAASLAIFSGLMAAGDAGFKVLGRNKKIKALQKFSSTGFTVVRGGK